MIDMDDGLHDFLQSGEHLPVPLRDFHDQKDLFKSMHHLYREDGEHVDMPNWVKGHQYVVDWFLWFMASRGYTLQKTRKKNVEFRPWPDFRKLTNHPIDK